MRRQHNRQKPASVPKQNLPSPTTVHVASLPKVEISENSAREAAKEFYKQNNESEGKWKPVEKWNFGVVTATAFFGFVVAIIYAFQLVEMRRATGAALRSIALSEDTARRQLRAYVGFNNATIEDKPIESATPLLCNLKNFGQTPAHGINCSVVAVSFQKTPGHSFANIPDNYSFPVPDLAANYRESNLVSTGYLEGGRDVESNAGIPDSKQWTENFLSKNTVYLYGEIRYIDIYNISYVHEFCYCYAPQNPKPTRLLSTEKHNREYEKK